MNDVRNRCMPHAVRLAEYAQAVAVGISRTNGADIIIGEPCLVIKAAAPMRWCRTTFLQPHVVKVLGLGAKEQMVRADTSGIVATMQHEVFRVLDRAVCQDPCEPRRDPANTVEPDLSVPHDSRYVSSSNSQTTY